MIDKFVLLMEPRNTRNTRKIMPNISVCSAFSVAKIKGAKT